MLCLVLLISQHCSSLDIDWNDINSIYGEFSSDKRIETLNEIKNTFYFGYNNYMKYAYPKDELDPINCKGRGPDYDDP